MLAAQTILKIRYIIATFLLAAAFVALAPSYVMAAPTQDDPTTGGTSSGSGSDDDEDSTGAGSTSSPKQCGSGDEEHVYVPGIDLGCKGKGNPIIDLLFAVIRFLSLGVGLVIVGSMVYAGIQYIGSRGDPNAHAMAVKRIQSNTTALFIFVFAYAIVNYVVPGALLK